MKRSLLRLCRTALVVTASWSAQSGGAESGQADSTGPRIILNQASQEIFPAAWRSGKINARAEPLAETETGRCRAALERALAKYPPALAAATLEKIYGLGRLEYSGVVTGGTRSRRSVYVVCRPSYATEDVERIFHAEYSSALHQQFPARLDVAAWQALNPPDFRYLGGGVQAVKAGLAGRRTDEETQARGFIQEYAQASVEEDFNSHAAPMWMGDAAYWAAVERHPKLKAKSDLVAAFYAQADASLNAAHFQNLREKAARAVAEAPALSLQRIFTDKEFEEEKFGPVCWSRTGGHYFTLEAPAGGGPGRDLVKTEASTGGKTVIATTRDLTPPGAEKPLVPDSFDFSVDEARVLVFTNTKKVWRKNTRGDYWVLDLATKRLRRLGGGAAASTLMFAKFSPDGGRAAYVRENNLEVQNLGDLQITPLTSDGSDTLINGTSDWVNEEELGLRDAFRWSPDGRSILFWQFDVKDVKTFTLINQTDGLYPRLTTFPYPKAGEKNSATRLGVISAAGGAARWLKLPGDPRGHYLPAAEWTPDGKSVLVQQFNRLQNELTVFLANPGTGEAKKLLIETGEAWVENKNTEPRWAGDGFVWLSERSGWRHAYQVSLSGAVKLITQGDFDVIDLLAVKEGGLCYTASPQNATQRYLYHTSLAGGEARRLTPADQPGTHSYDISPDAEWAVHTFSSMTTPPVVELVRLPAHETVRALRSQKALAERLGRLAAPRTEFLRVDIGGGLELDAWMTRAADLDLAKKHPLLIHVYGEPAGQTVKDAWGGQRTLWHQMLAQQGWVVASVDTRGTPAPRGRDWRKAVHRQLGILNVREEAAAVRALLQRFEFLDPRRVGIWGWSGGGSSSLDAIFQHPDLYQAAIAVAPVPDRRLYDSIYEERYMGLPAGNVDGYKNGSPITHAAKLEGSLLIIHGTGDDNVHYQGVEKLIDNLVAHNKPFTVMPYPNRDHAINTGSGTSRHLYELMTGWLRRHLPVSP